MGRTLAFSKKVFFFFDSVVNVINFPYIKAIWPKCLTYLFNAVPFPLVSQDLESDL